VIEIQSFVDGLVWVVPRPLRFHGVEMGTRMTIVRLGSGALWVHSPIDADDELRRKIRAIGPVRYVVAPSNLHHLFARGFYAKHPASELFVSPRLPQKSAAIAFGTELGDVPPLPWAGEIDQALVRGHRFLDEVVFLHRPSRTLIVADLLESAHADSSWALRALGRIAGIYERPGPPLDVRLTFRDAGAARASLERILAWDFDRIVLAHGHLIANDGKRVLRDAYAFLLDRAALASSSGSEPDVG
jgi:hypothetical protein